MAKQKRDEGAILTLTSEEILEMRKELADLKEQVKSRKAEPFEEIRKASVEGMANNAQITVRHFTDHKKVSLYHTNGFHIGKKIGPLHPGLLTQTFEMFKKKGVILSVTCPTPGEIEEYKQSDEYKAIAAKQKILKSHRDRPETSADVKRLADAMSKIAGMPADEIMRLKPQPVNAGG
jgi:hypothetical protein